MQEDLDENLVDQKEIFPIQKEKLKKKYWGLILFVLIITFAFGVSAPFWSEGATLDDYSEINVSNSVFSVQGTSNKPNEDLRIFVNSKFENKIKSDDEKNFSFSLSLVEGENIIEVFDENDKLVLKQKVVYINPNASLENTKSEDEEKIRIKDEIENNQSDQIKVKLNVTGDDDNSEPTPEVQEPSSDDDTEIKNEIPIQPVIYPSKIIISYIYYTQDALSGGGDEHAIIRNTGDGEKEITGYSFSDGDGNVFTFPYYVLKAGETVRINTGKGGFSFKTDYSVWDRVGEPAYLKDSQGRLIDIYSYQ